MDGECRRSERREQAVSITQLVSRDHVLAGLGEAGEQRGERLSRARRAPGRQDSRKGKEKGRSRARRGGETVMVDARGRGRGLDHALTQRS